MYALLLCNFIIPLVMLLAGHILKKYPQPWPGSRLDEPNRPGGYRWNLRFSSGYQSPRAKKSPAHWDYAQQNAPGFFIRYGKAALLVGLGCLLPALFLPAYTCVAIACTVELGCMLEAFIATEQALKDRFGI